MIPLLLSLCLLQSLHFGPKLNLDVDLAHFRGENATFQMKKYVATTVGVWLSPRTFQKMKNEHHTPTMAKKCSQKPRLVSVVATTEMAIVLPTAEHHTQRPLLHVTPGSARM